MCCLRRWWTDDETGGTDRTDKQRASILSDAGLSICCPSRPPCPPRPLELHLRRLLRARLRLEVRSRAPVAEHLGRKVGREGADQGVELVRRLVVILPRSRDPVLGPGELIHQLAEIGVRLE